LKIKYEMEYMMNYIKKVALASVACMALIGCGDSYSGSKADDKVELKVLKRNASFLTDTQGMSLYTFDKDVLNKSNCDAECQKIWPLFTGTGGAEGSDLTTPENDHINYRKHQLYYFVKDKVEADVLGNNVKNVWHLVHAKEAPADTQVTLSTTIIKQTYLTDKDGMALYTFDKDSANVSVCTGKKDTKPLGSCEARWPIFYAADLGVLPAGTKASDFGTIDRPADTLKDADGKALATKQTTYKGLPLYYWFKDSKAGDTSGDWVSGVWHLVETAAEKVDMSAGATTGESIEVGKTRFTGCATCHGADGLTKAFGTSIKIGELDDATKVETLLNYMKDDGAGKNPTMVGIAKGLSEDEIKNLSAYIGTL
jgi:predicted lipoprotein with Yx(FWY)xxD motif